MFIEDAQFAAFAPGLDALFRAQCVEALRARGNWPEERSVLAYILLATDIVLARPDEHIVRAVEAILGDKRITEWQRVRLAGDYFRQMHEPSL